MRKYNDQIRNNRRHRSNDWKMMPYKMYYLHNPALKNRQVLLTWLKDYLYRAGCFSQCAYLSVEDTAWSSTDAVQEEKIKCAKTARFNFAKQTWNVAWWMLAAHSLVSRNQNKFVWIGYGATCLAGWSWPGQLQCLHRSDCETWW